MPVQFTIHHTIRYSYSRPVFLEPHVVRMQPRCCGYQDLRQFDLQVQPAAAGMSHLLDGEGNNATEVWFDGMHEEVVISARSCVLTKRENPFDYLLRQSACPVPLVYETSIAPSLSAARQCKSDEPADRVAEMAALLVRESGGQLLPFLDQLNQTIYTDFECIHRDTGDPWTAAQTLEAKRGACRDFAVLFIDVCRCAGIAARFVSGYQEGDSEQERRELHAWAEVYVPGGGWRGYDPTHGLAVADRHVAIAASISPAGAAPLTGAFRGNGAVAEMRTSVELHLADGPAEMQQIQQQQQGRAS